MRSYALSARREALQGCCHRTCRAARDAFMTIALPHGDGAVRGTGKSLPMRTTAPTVRHISRAPATCDGMRPPLMQRCVSSNAREVVRGTDGFSSTRLEFDGLS